MSHKYSTYTSKELLQDDYFIESMMHPTAETDHFWASLIEDEVLSYEEFEQARSFLHIVKKPQRVMSIKEKGLLWSTIEIKNKEKLKRKIKRRNLYLATVAACLLAVTISSVYIHFIHNRSGNDLLSEMVNMPLEISESKDIQLIVSGEKAYTVEEEQADIVLNKEGEILVNSELLAEQTSPPAEETVVSYNQLIIPKGKHSKLTLPDGTQMHINSGSRVVFPQKFSAKKREIFVEGEVYLDVVRNEKSPFMVRTSKMNVEVLGTSFNLSAYEDEEEQSVVLVSGGVMVKTDNQKETQLSPNQMISYSGSTCVVSEVRVDKYISWKDGYIICENESMKSVLKRLSRYYGIKISSEPVVTSFKCNGKLDLKEDFQRVLDGLYDMYPIEIVQEEMGIHIKEEK